MNPRQRYKGWYTHRRWYLYHTTRKKRERNAIAVGLSFATDRPIASRTLARDERQRTDDVERRGGASGRDGDGGGGARETTRRRGGIEGDARERGGKTRAVIGVGLWRARGGESDDARSSEGDARDGIGDDERARVRDWG